MMQLIICTSLLLSSILFGELRPVPWLTEGAIAFLDTYLADHPKAKILEFGAGASTIWFAQRSPSVTTIEHEPTWYQAVRQRLSNDGYKNVTLILKPLPYYSVCLQLPREDFDLILVDGRNRKACILFAIPLLKKGGVLMLDNAERPYYRVGTDLLQGWTRFIDIQTKPDSCGFWYPGWTTSWWIKP